MSSPLSTNARHRCRMPRAFAVSVLMGCGFPGMKDAETDAGFDAGPRSDSGTAAGGTDASVFDADLDAGSDAGTDAGTGGGSFRDIGFDGGTAVT